jgi:hypothetical protein
MVQQLVAMILVAAASAPLDGVGDSKVEVIRGAQVGDSVGTIVQQERGVLVMRPAPDSFMRETRRLAAEAASREPQRPVSDQQVLVPVVVVKPYFPLFTDDFFYWTQWRRPPRPEPPKRPAPPVRP